jgi:aminopeptidase YwaD
MFQKWIEPFRREASGESAMNHVRVISTHHRIQASPGYREAAQYCLEQLRGYGLQAEIVSYPADPNTYFGNCRSFREWRCRAGELWLKTPQHRRLASYSEMEMSIIQRSTSTPPEGITTELIYVERAEEDAGYEGIDVRGKIVLARGSQFRIYDLAVEKYGAAGIILDNMTPFPPLRIREDLVDAVQYTSFWWYDEPKTGFGFAVSPRVGEQLRELCKKGTAQVYVKVDAELVIGEMENIEAFIPGETDEEVLLVSHLCHPKPGANDNASGPSTLMETARILQRLISEGKMAKPRRGIRFLMIPEMTGTHAYVNDYPERLKKTVAALNLDMVGADQSKSGGPLTVEKSSRALPSYTAELAYGILDEVAQDVSNFSKTFGYSLTNYVQTPFSGGSDHYIFGDPSVGIPCPMMITWPDKFYHTSFDKVDNIDPKMMGKVAITAATYLYWVANAGLDDLAALAGRMTGQLAAETERILNAFVDDKLSFKSAKDRISFVAERKKADLLSIEPLVQKDDKVTWNKFIDRQMSHVDQTIEYNIEQIEEFHRLRGQRADTQWTEQHPSLEVEAPMLDQIWVRNHPGPVELRGFLRQLSNEEREQWHQVEAGSKAAHVLTVLLVYWMDGNKTLREVIRNVELESGLRDVPFTLEYVRLLHQLELIKLA